MEFVILNKKNLQYLSLGKSKVAHATIAALKAQFGGHSVKMGGLELYHNAACDCSDQENTEALYRDLLNRL